MQQPVCMHCLIILSRTGAPGLFSFGLFSANGRILIPADIDSANCRIVCSPQNIVKTFPKVFRPLTFCGICESLLFSACDGTLTACSMEIKPLESGPALRSNRTGGVVQSLSSCTIQSPLQSRQGPSVDVAQRALRARQVE